MRKALYILADLDEGDIRWMADVGTIKSAVDAEVLVRAGNEISSFLIVLDGELAICLPDGAEVATSGVGDIVGEMSLVESRPPSVSVLSKGNSQLLAIPQSVIRHRLAKDAAFASRFYRALAVFLSDRLRGATARLGFGNAADDDTFAAEHELDDAILDSVHVAGDRMRRLLSMLEEAT